MMARTKSPDLTTAASGDDCCWSEGAQQGFTAQHFAHDNVGHLPGI
ncbi:MAG: hypothetical protein H0X73_11280 [Chthoniobacterales bacterium]|nr:hypothetical protein [Chthoniobacterales bacterium]